jgi:Amiloride-sensitive sodium channel
MFLAFLLFCVLISITTSKFLEGKIVLKLGADEVSVKDIPFPAVTICPEISLKSQIPPFDKNRFLPSDDG